MEEIKSLVLRVTERCNLRCAYCYAAGRIGRSGATDPLTCAMRRVLREEMGEKP